MGKKKKRHDRRREGKNKQKGKKRRVGLKSGLKNATEKRGVDRDRISILRVSWKTMIIEPCAGVLIFQ